MRAAESVSLGRNRHIAISAGSLAVLLGALDTYVVVTIMTDIMSDVGIAINKIQQVTPIITGYLLGYIAAMPLLGRASDRFGRKMLIQVGLAGFAIGSVITAMSGDLTTLVIGRVVQGTASGALLPVTLALAADLWAARNRAAVLGGVGAAQEFGSVLGPLYGIGAVALFHHWQAVFWINVPLAVIAMAMIHFSLPGKQPSDHPEKVDVVGGILLAIALGLAVVGLYNPEPDGKQVLPEWGLPVLIGALVAAIAFFVWEKVARTRLIEPAGVKFLPFLAALAASLCTGAALMVTLVNVELFGQGVLGKDKYDAAFLLLRFLIALPIGALIGGWIATRVGDRIVSFVGLMIAAGGFWLITHWSIDVLDKTHDLGLFRLPVLDTDLAIVGLGARFGDRSADLGHTAGGTCSTTRHRLGIRRGGPDDRHADRHGGAVRLGSVPLQPAPGEPGRRGQQQRDVTAGASGIAGDPLSRGVRVDVRRYFRDHRHRLCGGCGARPADRRA
ncbi:putative triacylglyceride transporter [Mycolicibacterium fortuitum subsp. fortuitum]|nr:putative triacylglyceride transporter [Mycolicibacterium fortuitum subsp. fortuitum]